MAGRLLIPRPRPYQHWCKPLHSHKLSLEFGLRNIHKKELMIHFMLKISVQELIIHRLLKGTQTHQSFFIQILVQENSFMNSLFEYWYKNSSLIPYLNIGKIWLLMRRCNKQTLHPYSRACPQQWIPSRQKDMG
jgi:hypothetical protein